MSFSFSFSYKDSPFFESEWIMKNTDKNEKPYFHKIIFKNKKEVEIQAGYDESNSMLVWSGKYKMNGRKMKFEFESCLRYENGEPVARVIKGNMIKYFNGDFFYALSEPNDEFNCYRMELIRPKNYFYGKNLDFMQQPMDTWCRVEKM